MSLNFSLPYSYESMTMLESKLAEAKAMKEQYIARARTAATATKVNDMLSGVGENSMSAFDRMKEKVESLETQAEVSSNMLGASKDVSLESKFKVSSCIVLCANNSVIDLRCYPCRLPGSRRQ